MERINFEEFAGGELSDKLNRAIKQVVENMLDVNTPYKNKRKIKVEIGFTQNETRDDVSLEIAVEAKLAAATPTKSHMAIGKDLRNGEIYAEEYGSQIKGQMSFSDMQPPIVPGKDVDPETGEILNEGHVVPMKKVIGG
jgi:hypothetical protein